MLAKPERLPALLARSPLPAIVLVYGDEPQQRMEAIDALRAAARGAGVEERLGFDAVVGLDWPLLQAEAGSLSLFATRRLIEINLGGKKPDKQGSAVLKSFAGLESPDMFLVTADALGREEQASEWYRAIDAAGVIVPCRPLDAGAFRDWLRLRASARGRELSGEAIDILALRAEGNLLAAAQEVDKLVLLVDQPQIDAEQVLAAVADSARYDIFKLIDAAVGGDVPRSLRMLRGLRAEGLDAVMVSWAVNRELRLLSRLSAAGRALDAAFAAERVWQKRQGLLRRALQRLSTAQLTSLLRDSVRIDLMIKGAATGQFWDELESLYIALAGGPWFGDLAARRAN